MSGDNPTFDIAPSRRAVFLSYPREDAAAAERIADALRSHGVEVWFDQSELRGGDAWDQKIRKQIRECALFVPIISERTQERGEGYFRLEWKLAVERSHLIAEGVPFLAPVVVDATQEGGALVPAEFLRVQWTRLPGSLPTPQFVEQIRRLLAAPRKSTFSPFSAPAIGGAKRLSRGRMWTVAALGAAVIAATVAVIVSRRSPPGPPAGPAVNEAHAVDPKSIAVLPFENMSEEKQNAYFTDGVQEDVLTNLTFIRDLHVVSRTSVLQYRGTTKSIKQIGRELGVAYVLEGSVQREGNKVRVTGQLIDARTDEHVWAKAYDRDLTDIFTIQGELAQAIAEALKAVISPEAKVLLARRPTENSAAYDAYLKARQLRDFGASAQAVPYLEQAVRLDPSFAVAWAELGSRRAFKYFESDSGAKLAPATEAIDTALRLAPDDPGVIEGVGDYYYYGYRDYTRATEQYLRLAQLRPNALEFAGTLANVRHFEEAESIIRTFLDANPHNLAAEALLAGTTFSANGSTAGMEAFAHRAVDPSEAPLHAYMVASLALARGDFAEFIAADRKQRYFDDDSDNPRWNQDATAASALAESGDMKAARARAAEALALMKAQLVEQPDNSVLWASIGLAHAILGDREETMSAAKKSAELMPESRDAIVGPGNSNTCAIALAWIGEKDRALEEIGRLLHVPFGLNVNSVRPWFRPLHDDPRFKALVDDPKNNDPIL